MRDAIRVLHVFKKMDRGGAETFIMNVYRQMDRKRIQFDFVVHCSDPGHYDDEIRKLGGRLFIVSDPKSLISHLGDIRRVMVMQGPFQAVHSHVHYFSGFVLRIANQCGVPVRISHSHTTNEERRESFLRKAYRGWMRRWIDKHATSRLGCSLSACESLFGRQAPRDPRDQIVANGIDLPSFIEKSMAKREIRRHLALPNDRQLIGQIGRFDPVKNHRFTLSIFQEARRRNPSLHLLLVGDGPLRSQTENLASELGIADSVTFYGATEHIPDILNALDLVLLPSLFEGLGLVLIEAQAAGVPIVCSSGIPEEADMGLGTMERLDLDKNTDIWLEAIVRGLSQSVPEAEIRYRNLRAKGFDIQDSTEKLRELYASSSAVR